MESGVRRSVSVDQTLAALADPTRRQVVEMLGRRPCRPTDMARQIGVTPAALSRHLRVLRRAELVTDARDPDDSRVRIYALRRERLRSLETWLSAFWATQLDAFADWVESE